MSLQQPKTPDGKRTDRQRANCRCAKRQSAESNGSNGCGPACVDRFKILAFHR